MKVPIADFSCATFIQRMSKSHQFTPRLNICGNRQAIQVMSKVREIHTKISSEQTKIESIETENNGRLIQGLV
jgi:hypothetical protein